MPGEDVETAQSAGISSAEGDEESVDVAALFERLKKEVRGQPGSSDGARAVSTPGRLEARAAAERFWPVAVDRPIVRRPGIRGALVYPIKRFLRRLMSWYVGPFAAEQRSFNAAALRIADELSELIDDLRGRLERESAERVAREAGFEAERASFEAGLASRFAAEAAQLESRAAEIDAVVSEEKRLVAELEERLMRLERRKRVPGTVAAQPRAASVPDYFAFETRMRGETAEIRRRQEIYVDDFREAAPVLDLGCGRGELLSLLREAGIEARGIDADADMVDYARGEGLDVEQADAVAALEALDDGSLGGIFAGQLVEHLPVPTLLRLLELATAKLGPGGLLVAETINPLSPLALRNYFADLTHAQPLVPETLAMLARQTGFASVETRYLNPPERTADVPPEVAEILFAPLDYAILART